MHFKMEKIQNNCPICIKDFKSMNSNSNISKQIVNIQRIINPYIFSYQYYSDSIKMKPETNCFKKVFKSSGGSHGHSGGRSHHHFGGGHHGGGHWGGHGGGGRRW